MTKYIFFSCFTIALFGCGNSGDERLKEKAGIESEGAAKGELKVINERAVEMETDLSARQRFFTALNGTFEGTLKAGEKTYNMRVKLVSSIPPFKVKRIRTVDEITFDLLNLNFDIQAIQWDPESELSSVGCRFEEIRPDLINGQVNLTSESCPNFYSLNVFRRGIEKALSALSLEDVKALHELAVKTESLKIASEILAGTLVQVDHLVGEMQPSTNSSTYHFALKRVQ